MLLPIEADQGLARLPAPSAGDVFLDLEGARFARDGGREYLFGLVILEADGSLTNRSYWAHSDAEERAAFETVVDEILRSWDSNPGMHVYHYAPYEPSAFRRLMGRYATRETEVDRMLRGRTVRGPLCRRKASASRKRGAVLNQGPRTVLRLPVVRSSLKTRTSTCASLSERSKVAQSMP